MIWLIGGYMWLFIHRPFEVWPALGAMQLERVYMISMLAYWVGMAPKRWLPNQLHLALGGLAGTLLLSFLASPYRSLLVDTVEVYLKLVVFYFVVVTSVWTEKDLRRLVQFYLASVGLYVGHSLWEFQCGRFMFWQGVPRLVGVDGTFGDPNCFAGSLVFTLPMTIPLWGTWRRRQDRVLLGLFCACLCGSVLLTGSRTGFIGMGAAVVLCLVGLGLKPGRVALVSLAGVTALLLIPGRLQDRLLTLIDSSHGSKAAQASAAGRIDGLIHGYQAFLRSPLLGFGPGSYPFAAGKGFNAHNVYGQALGELGGLGTLSLAAILWCFARNAAEVHRRYPRGRPRDFLFYVVRAANVNVILLCLLGCAGHNLYRSFWLWAAFFQIIALHCIRNKPVAAAARPAARGSPGNRLPYLAGPPRPPAPRRPRPMPARLRAPTGRRVPSP